MTLKVSESGGTRKEQELIPERIHNAVCYAIYDVGTQYNEAYDKLQRKVVIMWELPDFRITIEKEGEEPRDLPRAISKTYTASLGDRAILRKHLVSWRGRQFTPEELKGFDLHNVVGAQCNLQIVHNAGKGANAGKTYANIENVMPKMRNDPELRAENPLVKFSIEQHGAGMPPPDGCPKWISEVIMGSKEYKDALEVDIGEPEHVEPRAATDEDFADSPDQAEPSEDDLEDTPF